MIRKMPISKKFDNKTYYFVTSTRVEAYAKHLKKKLQDKGHNVRVSTINKTYIIWSRK